MKLKVFGSSSKGNAYALTDDSGNTLLIECGVPFIEIKKYLSFNISSIVGCIVSHSHGDHIGYAKEYLNNGINMSMSLDTATESSLLKHHRVKIIEPHKKYASLYSNFIFLAVELKHDVTCYGFVIKHAEMGNTVFITDTYYSPFKFKNINNWIVEANYSSEIIDKKVQDQETHKFLRNRILESHMSLENCIDMFKANDMSQTNNIVLTHLSDSNSNSFTFKEKVKQATCKTVYIAEKGLEINLNKYPF